MLLANQHFINLVKFRLVVLQLFIVVAKFNIKSFLLEFVCGGRAYLYSKHVWEHFRQ